MTETEKEVQLPEPDYPEFKHGIQFVMDWTNISSLRNFLDMVGENEDLFVVAMVQGVDFGLPELVFDLEATWVDEQGNRQGTMIGNIKYKPSWVDPATGVAYPEYMVREIYPEGVDDEQEND